MQQVSVYGLKGYLNTPAGASRSFLIRHNYEFADLPIFYVQASLGAESEESSRLERFSLGAGNTGAAQRTAEDQVRQLTRRIREQGVEETARWLFGSGPSTTQVKGVANGH